MNDEIRKSITATKAISDETRLRMLKLLLERDICVCEMAGIFPLSTSQLSRNLKILMDAGFLRRWREGKCVVYIADRKSNNTYCRKMLEMIAESFTRNSEISHDRAKLQKTIADRVREKRK